MASVSHAPGRDRRIDDFLGLMPRRHADGATLVCLFVVAILVVPARLVFRGIPLSLTPADVMALAVGMCWLCAHFTTTLGVAKGHSPVRTALFVYVVAAVATYGYATYGYLPGDELKLADHAAVLVLAVAGVALGICDGIGRMDRLDFVLKAVVAAGAVVAFVGVCQYMFNIDLTRYLKLPIFRYTSETGFITERSGRRVAGTTGHPIEFGVLCSMLVPLAAHYGFRARRLGEPALRWWVCAALIGAGLMFSVSRSAVLGFGCAAAVLFLGWPARRRLQAFGVLIGFLAVIKVVSPGLLGTFYNLFANAGSDDSVKYRTHDYAAAAAEISRHFWLGRGMGTWYAPKHQVFDNQWILTMVENGAVGTAAFALVFIVAIYAALKSRYLDADPNVRDVALSLVAGLVVPLIGSATFDLLSFHTVTGLAFLYIGAAGALLRITLGATSRGDNLPRSGGRAIGDGHARGSSSAAV